MIKKLLMFMVVFTTVVVSSFFIIKVFKPKKEIEIVFREEKKVFEHIKEIENEDIPKESERVTEEEIEKIIEKKNDNLQPVKDTKTPDEQKVKEPEKEIEQPKEEIVCDEYIFENGKIVSAFNCHEKNGLWTGNYDYVMSIGVVKNLVDQSNVVSYNDGLQPLSNPDRGLYAPTYIQIDENTGLFGNIDDIALRCATAVRNNISIIHLRINLSALSGNANSSKEDLTLTNEQLKSIEDILEVIRKFGLKVIIRCSYDVSGYADKEPKSLSTVLSHISSLKSVWSKNEDVIICFEAGTIGPWGEMHSGHGIYADKENVKKIIQAWLDNVPKSITVNVRVPDTYKLMFDSFDNNSKDKDRLGIFNDGYLGSSSDLGTFTTKTSRDEFINWMKTHGNVTFYGGEVTRFNPNENGYSPDVEKWSEGSYAIYEMPLTHTSYFNSEFNTKILHDKWKNTVYDKNDEYKNQTYYKYITDHIGYRILLRNSLITNDAVQGGEAVLKITLENVGFTNIIKKQNTYLILEKDGTYYQTKLNYNIQEVTSGNSKTSIFSFSIPSNIKVGKYNVYLKVTDELTNKYNIQFANLLIYNENLGANKVGEIKINSGSIKDITLTQTNTLNSNKQTKGTIGAKISYIPVKITYYLLSDGTKISQEQILVKRGDTIDLNNESQLVNLGIHIPSDYLDPKITSGINGWKMEKTLKIPESGTEILYWVDIYLKKDEGPAFEFIYMYGGKELGRQVINIKEGTILDIENEEQLNQLGFNVPTGYKISNVASGPITGWNGVKKLEIPTENVLDKYWITTNLILK